jgi:hypothetical protein
MVTPSEGYPTLISPIYAREEMKDFALFGIRVVLPPDDHAWPSHEARVEGIKLVEVLR